MIDLRKITGFEWDAGNLDKSYKKHGITPNQAEAVFLDEKQLVVEDEKHSVKEKRFTIIGKSKNGSILFIAFTNRESKSRIISARMANKKERSLYEET